MTIGDHHRQTVDIVRHTDHAREPSVVELVHAGSTAAIVIGTMTDLVCPGELLVHGRNALLGVSIGEWVVFVDDTTTFEPSWFDQLGEDLAPLARDFEVACSVGSTSGRLGDAVLDVAYRRTALDFAGGFTDTVDWSIDLEIQSRLISCGYAVHVGRRMVQCDA